MSKPHQKTTDDPRVLISRLRKRIMMYIYKIAEKSGRILTIGFGIMPTAQPGRINSDTQCLYENSELMEQLVIHIEC
ncbi:hypothetical protein AC579_7180 [Pseudocercospora musae]|uniref:Uncharacterized protein n=1 Tax=Pseudocercospora musae TaxID=113226 RepID=A0A139I8A2_9PEZI|nr:hypothetical protein AC579_7180 [Pseudocercospora musae]